MIAQIGLFGFVICTISSVQEGEKRPIAELIGMLGADDIATREQAESELRSLGGNALLDLKGALDGIQDSERKWRIEKLITEIESGIEMRRAEEERRSMLAGIGPLRDLIIELKEPTENPTQRATVCLYDPKTDSVVKLTGVEDDPRSFWVLGGKKIVYVSKEAGKEKIVLMNLDGTAKKAIIEGSILSLLNVSPDGKWIVYSIVDDIRDGTVKIRMIIRNLETERELTIPIVKQKGVPWGDAVWFADSTCLGYRYGIKFRVVDVHTGDKRYELPAKKYNGFQFSPDGKQLVFIEVARGGGFLAEITGWHTVDAKTGKGQKKFQPPTNAGSWSWSPDGKRFAFLQQEGQKIEVCVMAVNGADRRVLWEGKLPEKVSLGSGYEPMWSPDGRWLLFNLDLFNMKLGSQLIVMDVTEGKSAEVLKGVKGGVVVRGWRPSQ